MILNTTGRTKQLRHELINKEIIKCRSAAERIMAATMSDHPLGTSGTVLGTLHISPPLQCTAAI